MEFQNLDELYVYLRNKLLQKAKEKPTLIWRLQRHIEDDSYRNIETQSLSIVIVCSIEGFEQGRVVHSIIDKEVGNGGYPHDFLLKTLKFICEEKEKDKKFVCEGEQND